MNGFPQNLKTLATAVALGAKEIKTLTLSRIWKVFSLMGKNEKIALGLLSAIAIGSLFFSIRNLYYVNTTPAPAKGGSYSEGLIGQPTYINPLLAHDEPDLSLTNLIFSGLYKYDQNGQLIADLADGMPQISEDQKQYTVNLKHDAQWHNGKPFTADDIIFTIQTLQDPAYKSPLRALWQSTTVDKLSDFSVKFTTKDISAPFLNNLTLPILSKFVWSQVDSQNFLLSKNNLEAIGTGPYAIKEIKKLPSGKIEQISLEPFAKYYSGEAKISQLNFQFYNSDQDVLNAFHSREIQGFGFIPLASTLYLDKAQSQAQIITVPLPQYQVLFFNLRNKILSDQSVRNALSLATDKQKIIDQVFKGKALLPVSPFLFNSEKNPPLPSNKDLAKANELLDAAGWPVDSKTGIRSNKKLGALEINLATNDSLVNSKAAEELAIQWRELKIKVNLNIVPSKQLNDKLIKTRAFDALLFPQKFSVDPDPFLFWHSSQVKYPGFNLTGFSDQNADKLLIDARTTIDKNKRSADYAEFNNLVLSKTPVIFLDQTEYIYAADQKIKNIGIKVLYDTSYRFDNITNWYIDTERVWKK